MSLIEQTTILNIMLNYNISNIYNISYPIQNIENYESIYSVLINMITDMYNIEQINIMFLVVL